MNDGPLQLDILRQPNDSTCGPTCLHAVYRYYEDEISLESVIGEVGSLEEGGTLGAFLGAHALMRGYRARLYTYNLQVFDPTWFAAPEISLDDKLVEQRKIKRSAKLRAATDAYREFLRLGGDLRMEVLTVSLLRTFLKRSVPILTGLSSTFLYSESREYCPASPPPGVTSVPDDVRGYPSGHFVVLCGYDKQAQTVLVADPLESNPISGGQSYSVDIDRVFAAIMLGIMTFDANLLVIEPTEELSLDRRKRSAIPQRRDEAVLAAVVDATTLDGDPADARTRRR